MTVEEESALKKLAFALAPVLLSGVGFFILEFYHLSQSVSRIDQRLDSLVEFVVKANRDKDISVLSTKK